MTDKQPRKRAKALPVFEGPFDPAALWNYGPGVVYDPELPESVSAAIPQEWVAVLNLPAFTSALGAMLGRYHYYEALTTGRLSANDALKQTRQAVRALEDVVMRFHHLPPLSKSLLDLRAQTNPDHARSMLDRALALDVVLADLHWAATEIEKHFASTGRSASDLRDALLADVRNLILSHASEKRTKLAATGLMRRLLHAAHVPMPAKLDEIQRRIRDVERKRKEDAATLFATLDASASRGKNSA